MGKVQNSSTFATAQNVPNITQSYDKEYQYAGVQTAVLYQNVPATHIPWTPKTKI